MPIKFRQITFRFLLFILFVLFSLNLSAREIAGQVVAISDGDTLTVLDADKTQWRIRLAGSEDHLMLLICARPFAPPCRGRGAFAGALLKNRSCCPESSYIQSYLALKEGRYDLDKEEKRT